MPAKNTMLTIQTSCSDKKYQTTPQQNDSLALPIVLYLQLLCPKLVAEWMDAEGGRTKREEWSSK